MPLEEVDRIIYEYRREGMLDIDELNALGAEGWELVAVASHGLSPYHFKRIVGIQPMGDL